jgi:hypothetical protein
MKILREPLFHFLLIGAVLFVVFDLVSEPSLTAQDKQIVVSAGRIQQFANIFVKTWQRPPTAAELKGLIDDFVLEEIYYRQAVAMGIDRDDTVIRRRMRQKFEFLTDDLAATIQPTDEELAAYLAAKADVFKRDTTYTFEQVYINPDQAGVDLDAYLADQLTALRTGNASTVNSGLLPSHFDREPARFVDNTFGTGFSKNLDALTPGEWLGPVESGLGFHLVRLETRVEGTLPELSEIKPVIEREWANEKRLETRRMINEQLLKNYEVEIEWPRAQVSAAP